MIQKITSTIKNLCFFRFQAAIKKYGVPEEEIFQTADLFERRNIPQVTLCLYSLGRIVKKTIFTSQTDLKKISTFRLKNIQNLQDLHLDQRWLTRMNVPLPKSNYVPMKVNWTYKWVIIKEHLNLAMVVWETLVICKFKIFLYNLCNFWQKLHINIFHKIMTTITWFIHQKWWWCISKSGLV